MPSVCPIRSGHVVQQVAAARGRPCPPIAEGVGNILVPSEHPDFLRLGAVGGIVVAQLSIVGIRIVVGHDRPPVWRHGRGSSPAGPFHGQHDAVQGVEQGVLLFRVAGHAPQVAVKARVSRLPESRLEQPPFPCEANPARAKVPRVRIAAHPATPLHQSDRGTHGTGIGVASIAKLLLADPVPLGQQAQDHELVRCDPKLPTQFGVGPSVQRLICSPQADP